MTENVEAAVRNKVLKGADLANEIVQYSQVKGLR